jgi:hypothetical protein
MMDPACRSRCLYSIPPACRHYCTHTGAAGGAVAAAVMLNTPTNPLLYYRKEGGIFIHTYTKKIPCMYAYVSRLDVCVYK